MHNIHQWDITPQEAIKIQYSLRGSLLLAYIDRKPTSIGGVDVSIKGEKAKAAIVVLRCPDLTPLDSVTLEESVDFPYIPGLLSFREGPVVLKAWKRLLNKPDMLMFDGQGIAHPRGMGIAAHLGIWLQIPTIGVAKSHLYGNYTNPGYQRGSWSELIDERDPTHIIGAVLRTKENVKPLFISPGHMMDVEHAIQYVMLCCTTFRLPETTRWAHRVAAGHQLPEKTSDQPRVFDLRKTG